MKDKSQKALLDDILYDQLKGNIQNQLNIELYKEKLEKATDREIKTAYQNMIDRFQDAVEDRERLVEIISAKTAALDTEEVTNS